MNRRFREDFPDEGNLDDIAEETAGDNGRHGQEDRPEPARSPTGAATTHAGKVGSRALAAPAAPPKA